MNPTANLDTRIDKYRENFIKRNNREPRPEEVEKQRELIIKNHLLTSKLKGISQEELDRMVSEYRENKHKFQATEPPSSSGQFEQVDQINTSSEEPNQKSTARAVAEASIFAYLTSLFGWEADPYAVLNLSKSLVNGISDLVSGSPPSGGRSRKRRSTKRRRPTKRKPTKRRNK